MPLASRRITTAFRREDSRGRFLEVLREGLWASFAHGNMRAGAVMGNHYHKQTEVFFYLLSGSAEVSLRQVVTGERGQFDLASGEGIIFAPLETHAIRFQEDSAFVLMKTRLWREEDQDIFSAPVDV